LSALEAVSSGEIDRSGRGDFWFRLRRESATAAA
jgi:hypothetical protein